MKTFKKRDRSGHKKKPYKFSQKGYTLVELMVTLAILSLLTGSILSLSLGNQDRIMESAFNVESHQILYTLLQYQNEAMMDGCRRQIRFQEKGMLIIWTKDKVLHQVQIPVENFSFSGAYTGITPLNLYAQGTVSMGGTVVLTSPNGRIKNIIVQVGNGRIYLDEP